MSHRFIDTHCHFDFPPFAEDETASLARAAQAGVGQIIVPAISAARFNRVLALAAQHEALYTALGMHPIVMSVPASAKTGGGGGDWPRSLSRRSAV